MKPHPDQNLPDFDADLENDSVWSLLDDATHPEASPRFVQDTLRRLRLDEDQAATPWWKSLLAPKPILGITGAALAALAIIISLPSDPPAPQAPLADLTEPTEDWNSLEDTFARDLLSGVAEDPSLLSDEEIVALLY